MLCVTYLIVGIVEDDFTFAKVRVSKYIQNPKKSVHLSSIENIIDLESVFTTKQT